MIRDGCPYANRKVLIKGRRQVLAANGPSWNASETGMSICLATSFQVRPWSRSSRICWVEAG
jgi:hypothetical protein